MPRDQAATTAACPGQTCGCSNPKHPNSLLSSQSCAQTGTAHTPTTTSRNSKCISTNPAKISSICLPTATDPGPGMVPEQSLPAENLSTAQHPSLQGPPLHKHVGHSCKMKQGGRSPNSILYKRTNLSVILYIINIYKYNLTLKYISALE